MSGPATIAPLQAEADTRRWLERAVIGLNLCPFAKAVHVKGQIHYAVYESAEPADLMDALLAKPKRSRPRRLPCATPPS
jgi:hypothetical protein